VIVPLVRERIDELQEEQRDINQKLCSLLDERAELADRERRLRLVRWRFPF